MTKHKPVKVIDLFAGPGGLGEGFSSLTNEDGERNFSLRVSIEKNPIAHKTLSLRALFRAFPKGEVPDCYYDYVKGKITREELFKHSDVPDEARNAAKEAKNVELGKISPAEVDSWIAEALDGADEWVLIGGPPCQAYSLAGRARRTRETLEKFEEDEKHFLYKEYLRIIQQFRPSVFVMENVKGILSSQHGGSHIFQRILADLSSPADDLTYQIRSFVVAGEGDDLDPRDFIIESERFGVPQNRHRVILFGIRSDLADRTPELKEQPRRFIIHPSHKPVTVKQVLNDLPPLRSRLSKEPDSNEAWLSAVSETSKLLAQWDGTPKGRLVEMMNIEAPAAATRLSTGGQFVSENRGECLLPKKHKAWYINYKLDGFLQHETRSHMRSDLHRYLFASCYAKAFNLSPKLAHFPPNLLPAHENATDDDAPFTDRFRVQLATTSSSTVVAHIAKDGHHFIHYDPSQCRSLTVREAARLQTFPDDYFFEGSRTEQYTQVGNAVPPWLAKKIATVVLDFLTASRPKPRRKSRRH
ncbi:DNA (cytosine-5-)-methyltransferase [Janthinobacterium sp. BJB412]|nr:DNA (cytosine-5-)-methyltransferase [Janthinobacterium sp. BJB412]